MPKEIINSKFEPTHLHVGWTKDLDVQVGVINTDIKSKHPGDTSAGWFMQLDRAGCNRAIRALRKARDDAFGRDE